MKLIISHLLDLDLFVEQSQLIVSPHQLRPQDVHTHHHHNKTMTLNHTHVTYNNIHYISDKLTC